jgi:hypothetical protein
MGEDKGEKLIGQLPGTGGDFIDPKDVEGHRRTIAVPYDQDTTDTPTPPTYPDVEGDVEGHLYRGGPSTQGEIIRRGPGENPHGER